MNYQYYLHDSEGWAPSQDIEFQAGTISVKLIKGQIANSKVSIYRNSYCNGVKYFCDILPRSFPVVNILLILWT